MPSSCVISNWLKEYINQDTIDLLVLHVIRNSFYSINSISTAVGLCGINVNWLYKELSVLHKKTCRQTHSLCICALWIR